MAQTEIKHYLKIHVIPKIDILVNGAIGLEVRTLEVLLAEGEAVPQLVAVFKLQHVPHLHLDPLLVTLIYSSPVNLGQRRSVCMEHPVLHIVQIRCICPLLI